jgi:hypothetical protein
MRKLNIRELNGLHATLIHCDLRLDDEIDKLVTGTVECAELDRMREFIGDLVEIEHNDADAAYWRSEALRIPSGMTLYLGGNKPKTQ